MILYLAAWQSIPRELYEAARIDGASRWHCFRFIILPSLAETHVIVLSLAVINGLKVFDLIYTMTCVGPGTSTHVLGTWICFPTFQYCEAGYGAALAWIIAAIVQVVAVAVPVQVKLQPYLIMMKSLGIRNTLWALIPPCLAFGLPFQIFVMRGFFRLLPNELIKAARVDGASETGIFFRIMLPLSLPPLAMLFIIDLMVTWNEFLIALVLISSYASRTVPIGLMQFQVQNSSQYMLLMAGA